ncbi:MAG: hypothetical protein AB7K63_11570 [Vicinamibacterales bacterium]
MSLTAQSAAGPASAEARAVAYLSREVPRWRQEHPCYSCHNNGDGTRALVAAARAGLVEAEALRDEAAWLRTPGRWSLNADEGGVKDLALARIQFASALAALVDAGRGEQDELAQAVALVAADQRADGSWPISAAAALGSPAGYGTTLATAVARRLLDRVEEPSLRGSAARTDAWLRGHDIQSVLDASSVLLGLGSADDAAARAQTSRALEIIAKGQAREGGWGPYVTSPPEPFDTALVLLAIASHRDRDPAMAASFTRGRQYLLSTQLPDGSWPETTRPAGNESYAQRISTTAWALVALLATAN